MAVPLASPASAALWIGGDGDWNDFRNWLPIRVPDNALPFAPFDVDIGAFVNSPNPVVTVVSSIGDVVAIETLELFNGSDVLVGVPGNGTANRLRTNAATTLNGSSAIWVRGDAFGSPLDAFVASSVSINDNSQLAMRGGRMSVFSGPVDVETNASVTGFGRIDLDRVALGNPNAFNLTGTLRVGEASLAPGPFIVPDAPRELEINASDPATRIDLDGTGSGRLILDRNASLDLNVPLSDAFDGSVAMGPGSVLDIQSGWTHSGTILVNTSAGPLPGQAATPATITGGALQMRDASTRILLDQPADHLRIDAEFLAESGRIDLQGGTLAFARDATIDAGAELRLGGSSEVRVENNAIVQVNGGSWDWDGDGGLDNVIVVEGRDSALIVERNGPLAGNLYGGRLILDEGEFRVDQIGALSNPTGDWGLSSGVIDVRDGPIPSQLRGQFTMLGGEINVDPSGRLDINGRTRFSGGRLTVNGALFRTGNSTEWAGTEAVGNGILLVRGATFTVDQTIGSLPGEVANTLTYDLAGGAHVIEDGVTVRLNVRQLRTFLGDQFGDPEINLNGGTLFVDVADDEWRADDETVIRLRRGVNVPRLQGDRLVLDGGDIWVDTAVIDSDLEVQRRNEQFGDLSSFVGFEPGGGTLDVNGVLTLSGGFVRDFDRSLGGGRLNPNGGIVVVDPFERDGFGGSNIPSAVNVDVFDWSRGNTTIESRAIFEVIGRTISPVPGDRYDATLTINDGTLLVDQSGSSSWVADGEVFMNATSETDGPKIFGDRIEFGDDVNSPALLQVSGEGVSEIQAPVKFLSDVTVRVDAGAELFLSSGSADFSPVNGSRNAPFVGAGTLRIAGGRVSEATRFDMAGGTVALSAVTSDNDPDVDNPGSAGNLQLFADLTVNARILEDYGHAVDGLASSMTFFDGAALTVNLDQDTPDAPVSWRVAPEATLTYVQPHDTFAPPFLVGDRVVLDGTLNVNGEGSTLAELDIGGTLNLNRTGRVFGLSGATNRLSGGTVNGGGVLSGDSRGSDLIGHGVVNADLAFTDEDSRVVAEGGDLVINGGLRGIRVFEVNDAASRLVMNADFVSRFTSLGVRLRDGGEVAGSGSITLESGAITGVGRVTAAVTNNQRIEASNVGSSFAGSLVIENPASDLDGTTEAGSLFAASGGTLELRSWSDEEFNGEVFVAGSGAGLFTNGQALRFGANASTTLFTRAAYRTNSDTTFAGGLLTFGEPSITAEAGARFMFGPDADVTLGDSVNLEGDFVVAAGADFAGTGSLDLNPRAADGEHTLTLAGGASVAVRVRNAGGTLEIGGVTGPASATVLAYEQATEASLAIDLDGVGPGQFDTLSITDQGSLDGTMAVSVNYAASVGDIFTLITGDQLLGGFADVDVAGLAPGLDVDVAYTPTSVSLAIVAAFGLPGDFNGNGAVEQGDLDLVLGNWGQPRGDWSNAGGFASGAVDQEELDAVLGNWGASPSPTVGGAGPAIPEPGVGLGVGLGLGLIKRCRHLPRLRPSEG